MASSSASAGVYATEAGANVAVAGNLVNSGDSDGKDAAQEIPVGSLALSLVPVTGPEPGLALVAHCDQKADEDEPEQAVVVPDGAVPGGPVARCSIDCGCEGPLANLRNMYTQRCPRYACVPCNNARRAIEHQIRGSSPEVKAWYLDFKKGNPEQWKAKVRACSLSMGEVASGRGDRRKYGDRAQKVAQFISGVEQFVTVQEVCEVTWLRRGQYIAHMRQVENLSEDEAVRKWQKAVETPSVQRTGAGPDLAIAVALPRKTVAARGKTTRAGMSLTEPLDSDSALTSATKRVKVSNLCRGPDAAAFEDVGASVFRTGASSSTGRSDDAVSFPNLPLESVPLSLSVQRDDLPWAEKSDEGGDMPLATLLIHAHSGVASGGPDPGSVGFFFPNRC